MGQGGAEAARLVPLAECAEVLPGYSVPGRLQHDPDGTHQLILTKHLSDGVPYRYRAEHEFRLTPKRRADRYEVWPGDVLFMSRGTRNLAWAIEAVPKPSVAPVSFYLVRPGPGTDARYLAWYLNQAPVKVAIDQVRTGAGTPIVQRRAFQTLEIVLPSLETQQQIADLGILLAQERELQARLAESMDRSRAALGRRIIEQLRTDCSVGD